MERLRGNFFSPPREWATDNAGGGSDGGDGGDGVGGGRGSKKRLFLIAGFEEETVWSDSGF